MLGDSIRRVRGDSSYLDAEFLGFGNGNLVIASATERDQADSTSMEAIQNFCIQWVIDEGTNCGVAIG
jgi:hypothetical protein